jgi:hypothetical protein
MATLELVGTTDTEFMVCGSITNMPI